MQQAIVGVDPHKRVLSAVALDGRGGRLGQWQGSATGAGIGRSGRGPRAARPGRPGPSRAATCTGGAWRSPWCRRGRTCGTCARRGRPSGAGGAPAGGRATPWTRRRWPASCSPTPTCPHAFKTAAADLPDPARETLAVLVRARHQVVDRHRRLLNEAEALLTELPAALAERLPGRKQTPPRLAAAARLRRTGDRVTDLRLRLAARPGAGGAGAGGGAGRPRARDRRRPGGARHHPAHALRPRAAGRGGAPGTGRRPAALPLGRRLRRLHRHGPHPRLLGRGRRPPGPPPAQPLREPPPELRAPHHGRDAFAHPPGDAGLHRRRRGPGQVLPRRAPHRQAAPGPARLADHDARRGPRDLTQRSFRSRPPAPAGPRAAPTRPTHRQEARSPAFDRVRPAGNRSPPSSQF